MLCWEKRNLFLASIQLFLKMSLCLTAPSLEPVTDLSTVVIPLSLIVKGKKFWKRSTLRGLCHGWSKRKGILLFTPKKYFKSDASICVSVRHWPYKGSFPHGSRLLKVPYILCILKWKLRYCRKELNKEARLIQDKSYGCSSNLVYMRNLFSLYMLPTPSLPSLC